MVDIVAETMPFTLIWASGWDAATGAASGEVREVGWAETYLEALMGVKMLLPGMAEEQGPGVLAILHTPSRSYAGGLTFTRRLQRERA